MISHITMSVATAFINTKKDLLMLEITVKRIFRKFMINAGLWK